MNIAGVLRAEAFSPNNIGNDAAILNAVADRLRDRGCAVNIYTEEQFLSQEIEEKIILNMCRGHETVRKLKNLQDGGRLVINSAYGIENCARERMTKILLGNGIPYPESLIVNTGDDVSGELAKHDFGKVWIKRGDSHAVEKEDVSFCCNPEEVRNVLDGFCRRGIGSAVINRHLEGDLIKFYGVRGQDWFYWFYPSDEGHSKYGHEAVNGRSRGFRFDPDSLKTICQRASGILDVKIFGGDCIVDAVGKIRIIDFNDWPSFAPCRSEAASHIAECVWQSIETWKKL